MLVLILTVKVNKATMKCALFILFLIFGIFLCLDNVAAQTEADLKAMEVKAKTDCVKETNLTADEIKLVNDGTLLKKDTKTATNNLQCYVNCYYKKFGLLDAEGKLKQDVIMKYLDRVAKDKSKIKPTYDKCSSIKGANDCETSFNIEKCFIEAM